MIFSTNIHAKLIFCVDITIHISKVDKLVTVIRKISHTKKIECKQIANNYSFKIDIKSLVYKYINKYYKEKLLYQFSRDLYIAIEMYLLGHRCQKDTYLIYHN